MRSLLAAVKDMAVTPMSAGQRQSVLLLVPLAIALLLDGMPESTVSPFGSDLGQPAVASAPSVTEAPAPPAVPDAAPPALPPPSPARVTGGSSASAAAAPRPAVVGLVRAGDAADAEMARFFLGRRGVDATFVELGDDPAAACRAASSATVVVAGAGRLPAELRRCLVAGGVAVVAYDDAGDLRGPAAGGTVLSTRRGVADAVADLARWGLGAGGSLKGRKVGVVGTTDVRPDVEPVIQRLAAEGLNVVASSWLPATGARDTSAGVLAFAQAGVEVTLFAAPVDLQREWAQQGSLLSPAMRYVVADTADSVVEESYPLLMDGAVTVTAGRVPWFARTHGATAEQQDCRQSWDGRAPGAQPAATAAALVRLFAWCQHAALTASGLSFGGTPAAFRALRVPSPLTSDLGPLQGGGWGPTADAVLTWRASCSCWTETRPFKARDLDRGAA